VRLRATTGEERILIRDVYVYGDRTSEPPAVGGIYTSVFPPVAGEHCELRAVIRNSTAESARHLEVEFEVVAPYTESIGKARVRLLPAEQARLATVDWTPELTEPHEIRVTIRGSDWETSARSEVIPVVNRRMYFGCFHPVDYERLAYTNLFTTIGGGSAPSPFYPLVKLRGRTGLAFASGPHPMGERAKTMTADEFVEAWWPGLSAPWRDGIAMDEWGTPLPDQAEALRILHNMMPHRMIVPWVMGGMNEGRAKSFAPCALLLSETYLNYLSHDAYRIYVNDRVDGAREWDTLDRFLIALGTVAAAGSTREELERETRYAKLRGPEMPGIAYYGYNRSECIRFTDSLCYKYWIAPAVTVTGVPQVQGTALTVNVKNIGGMTACDIKLEAYTLDGRARIGTGEIDQLYPDEEKAASFTLTQAEPNPQVRVLPSEQYTEMTPPQPLEIMPARQIVGGPLQIYWTPRQGEAIGPNDRIEIVHEASGTVVYERVNDGNWQLRDNNLVFEGVPTENCVETGQYVVRLVDGATEEIRALDYLTIISPPEGKFYVTKVNDQPWAGDPHNITINPGDTFEITWDLRDVGISRAAVYLNCPEDPTLRAPHGRRYASFNLAVAGKDEWGVYLPQGSWTWKSALEPEDLDEVDSRKGWLHAGNDPKYPRIDMAGNPGVWHLWIGQSHGPHTWSLPRSPVITVIVRG